MINVLPEQNKQQAANERLNELWFIVESYRRAFPQSSAEHPDPNK